MPEIEVLFTSPSQREKFIFSVLRRYHAVMTYYVDSYSCKVHVYRDTRNSLVPLKEF